LTEANLRKEITKLHNKTDDLSALLCKACKMLPDESIAEEPELEAWWRKHQTDDRNAMITGALEKLSTDEIKVLKEYYTDL
jgi:hypothetical protein